MLNDNGKHGRTGLLCGNAVRFGSKVPRSALALIAGLLFLQSGCFLFRRHPKAPAAVQTAPAPIRIALLPLNTPAENPDGRWLSLASAVVLARAGVNVSELEIVPFWESMPVAIQSMGTSRSISPDQAAYMAGLLTAKWATSGEISTTKGGLLLLVDFMPAKETMIPFRYQKQTDVDSLSGNLAGAVTEFLRYQVAAPAIAELPAEKTAELRELAQALDLEYGWFVPADPGKSEKIVANLARSDAGLAQVLFNPNLYPAVARAAAEPQKKRPGSSGKSTKRPAARRPPWRP